MIVPMKKVTVLCMTQDQDNTLEALRNIGVVHVSHMRFPEGEDVDKARHRKETIQRVLEAMPKHHVSGSESVKDAREAFERVANILEEDKALSSQLDALRQEHARIEPFGSFDPSSVQLLEEKGIYVRLFHAGPKDKVDVEDSATLISLADRKEGKFFAIVSRTEPKLKANPVRLPEQSLAAVERDIQDAEKKMAANKEIIESLADRYPAVLDMLEESDEALDYVETRAGMGEDRSIAYLQGYCPDEAIDSLRKASADHGWGLLAEDPAPEDKVPTLLKVPGWVKPMKAVYNMIGIAPGYDELDISPVFLIFFSLFYGMLVGDAGYGLIFLVFTAIARLKFKTLPKALIRLLLITSLATIVWGVITGTYLGIGPEIAPLKISWLDSKNTDNLMELCFLIGAIHLSLAHIWKAYLIRNTLQSLAQLGWAASTWGMFFVARHMILNQDLPPVMLAVLGVGVLLVFLFMTPVSKLKEEWFNHAMFPLNVISNFVDVVSYVRLFAVGAATLAVASAFNDMAAGWVTGAGSIMTKIGLFLLAAMVLFLGHALNMGMALLGVMVHGIRLNTLEFSQHMDITWKGFTYRPFARRRSREPSAE